MTPRCAIRGLAAGVIAGICLTAFTPFIAASPQSTDPGQPAAPPDGMLSFTVEAPGGRPIVFWHAPADSAIARALAEAASGFVPAPVARLALPPQPFTVVVAPSEQAFTELTGGRVPDWGLAVAFPSLGRVVVRSPRLTGRIPVDPAVVLRHELGHLYLVQGVGGEASLPRWFHEGFAALYADEWRFVAPVQLAWARATGSLTPLQAMTESFPGPGDPSLAYVQSMAAVRDLRRRGGDEGVAQLLARVREGGSFDRAMRETYGLTEARFYALWSEELGGYGWLVLTDERGIWVLAALLVVVLWVIRRRTIRREIRRRRAAEDAALGDPEDHSLGVEEQDRYWEHDDDEAWRGEEEEDNF